MKFEEFERLALKENKTNGKVFGFYSLLSENYNDFTKEELKGIIMEMDYELYQGYSDFPKEDIANVVSEVGYGLYRKMDKSAYNTYIKNVLKNIKEREILE